MEYIVKIPAVNGDVISLLHLGTCMASAHATAYGKTDFYEQRFQSCFRRFDQDILEEAQAGRLQVCNDIGQPGTADEIIDAVKKTRGLMETRRYIVEPDWDRVRKEHPPGPSGEMDLQGVDLGPAEIDLVYMRLECLHVKLHHLNEWAKVRGDTFSISHEGVVWLEGYIKNGKLESQICGCTSDMEQSPPQKNWLSGLTWTARPVALPAAGLGGALTDSPDRAPLPAPFPSPNAANADDSQTTPWLIEDPRDPEPEGIQPWYTPARYFARELVRSNSTLLAKRPVLARQVAESLAHVGYFKRGKKKQALDGATVLKALANVILS